MKGPNRRLSVYAGGDSSILNNALKNEFMLMYLQLILL
jgi:hypothetical protein